MLTLEVGQHEVVHFNVYINTYVNIQKGDQRIGGRSTLRFTGSTEAISKVQTEAISEVKIRMSSEAFSGLRLWKTQEQWEQSAIGGLIFYWHFGIWD